MRLCQCGAIIQDGGRCAKCKPAIVPHEKTTKERGYGSDWKQFSVRKRDENPICEVHDARGQVFPSTQVHHVEKIRDAPEKRLDERNTIAVCGECHRIIEGMTPVELANYLERLRANQ